MKKKKGFIIQNIDTKEYVCSRSREEFYPDPALDNTDFYSFECVEERQTATIYPTLKWASQVAFWCLGHFQKWRVVDTNTEKTYIRDYANRFKEEIQNA